ncbi:damage-indicible protein DnaD [Bacillus subtilis]|uniref:conserved phage C-terminal domain-containing protein n=1 Tax=Bacillus subtilis TaxID=1423 RepID=UPI00062801FF|nr:conserved phage C-terminal domain-containing protein [Bacillus subtilis]KKJ80943.1 damage-indicible protein DnaD [Bacillus subtilis]MDK7656595.1 conserved phage C-terminal domain-containing protein [Bacillus subtilis]
MAKYRHVRTEFWQDPKVLEEMTPEDRYFYLYLLTNPFTTQIGIYSITKKQMAFDIGYSIESINSLMDRFQNHHRLVVYNSDTREIAIIKWGKYNLNKAGKPMMDCIEKELQEVKDKTLIELVYPHIPNDAIRESFSRYVNDTYNDTLTSRGQKEKEKEKEKEKYILSSKLDDTSSKNDVIPYKLIIDLLNKVSGKNYRSATQKTRSLIKARWNEGFRFNDFKHVILVKTQEWLNDPEMNKFIRPETLFGTKFENYLNQKGGRQFDSSPANETNQYTGLF